MNIQFMPLNKKKNGSKNETNTKMKTVKTKMEMKTKKI